MTTSYATPALLPAVPGLDSTGLGFIRDDCLARAASAERQGAEAAAAGNYFLAQRCGGEASALRNVAAQIVAYALIPNWQTDTTPEVYPVAVREAVTA